jgi:hypothetical protein
VLKLKASPTFTTPVTIPSPDGDITIKVEFRHMTKDAYSAFIEAERTKDRGDKEALMDIMAGWHEVDTPFSAEAVGELCQQYHAAAGAIVSTFIEQLTQYKRKN